MCRLNWLYVGMTVMTGIVGCSSSERSGLIGLVPVSGQISLDGKPLPNATVLFIPASSAGTDVRDAGALTNEDGKYELKTDEGSDVGALPGSYRVVISKLVMPDGSVVSSDGEKSPMELTIDGAKESVPRTYSDLAFSKLKATVTGADTALNFDLKSR